MCMLHLLQFFREGVDLQQQQANGATTAVWQCTNVALAVAALAIYKPTYATMQIKSHKLSFKFKMAFK